MLTERMLTDKHQRKADELCELLPWYVNNTLDEAEALLIDEHLRQCQSCAKELPILQAVSGSVHRESISVLTPKPDAEKFLAGLAMPGPHPGRYERLWVSAAVAASVALFVVFLAWIQKDDSNAASAVYQTATTADSGATFDYVMLISFDSQTDEAVRADLLQALSPVSIAEADSAGAYRVVVRLPARSMHELEQFRLGVESNLAISSVVVVAVELPVEPR